jgi:NAD(P)-dependent dehydrogenase (short-subunit alcohol dehydrogenase family)
VASVTLEYDIERAVNAAVERYGRLDLMFNNAGVIGVVGKLVDLPVESYDRTMAILLRAPILGMKHAARVMIAQHSGVVILEAAP